MRKKKPSPLLLLCLTLVGIAAIGLGVWRFYPRSGLEANLPSDEVLPVPPPPPRLGADTKYNQCLDMIETDPQGALDFAEGLTGVAAMHCKGLAEIELGEAAVGAPILMLVGSDVSGDPDARAAILGQASRAYLMIDQAEDARAASKLALTLLPDDPDVRFNDALAAMAGRDFTAAVADLEITLGADPKRGEALVARATSYRQLGRLDLALADADAALALDQDDQDALLERGIIRQREGDQDGARADWQQVEAIDPDSSTADLATQNLELLQAAGG